MVRLGQHPAPRHTIAHISDTHFLDGARPLYGALSSETTLQRALDQLEGSGLDIEAIVFTGDLADLGESDAYQRLRSIVDPVAERLGAQIVWVMGNHDEREPFARHMLDAEPSTAPQDAVYDIGGLRIIALDSTVPGYHHGEISAEQLDWLRGVLAEPAPHGTLLALHHPPIPSPVELMAILELQDQPALAEVLRGTDVIGILGGHLHYSTHSTFAGIPVAVAAATCYTMDVLAPVGSLSGVDGGQSVHLTQVYDDRVVHSIVPIGSPPQVSGFGDRVLERLAALTPEERREAFSNKKSVWKLPPEN
ncbi:3',5'-cyclic adenosine monophosphate phosphodiesterase CpdA [Schumannella luteola]|uniref:3',5'-cyclic AMP phosphodiesterase CpdA n=1 Tax=Schumannella luteola TaxID=472059 RepID=A0A852YIR9_9MICO|nr:3',5'-cyclic AMP phosphodiesterase CpdA [Schumannella luteola]TPX06376.1 phosphodiesterase [Schumannella luteola]